MNANGRPTTKSSLLCWPRPYASTWVFIVFLAVIMVLLNVPGQVVVDTLVDENETIAGGPAWYIHGWPLTTLRRGPYYLGFYSDLSSPWSLTEDVYSVESHAIALDVLTAVLLIVAGGVLFQAWRSRGGSLRRYRLSTFFVFVTLVAVAIQYVVRQRAAGQADRAAVAALPADRWPFAPQVQWQPWGPTWLRRLIGDGPFEGCDRAVCIGLLYSRDLPAVLALRELKAADVSWDISNDQLQALRELPELEDLSLSFILPEDPDIDPANPEAEDSRPRRSIPPLAYLRRLDLNCLYFGLVGQEGLRGEYLEDLSGAFLKNLGDSSHRLAGLETLQQLEDLHLSGAIVCDDELRAVGTLRKLRFLSIEKTILSRAGLAHLAGLTDLRELRLDGYRADDLGIQFLSELKQLRSLSLRGRRLTDASIASLKPLSHLESLTLWATKITPAGLVGLSGLQGLRQLSLRDPVMGCATEVHHLAALQALRELYLDDYSLTDADVPSLARFTHLESFGLHNTGITAAGFAALRAALPNCEIKGG